jgi:hypothetical protein
VPCLQTRIRLFKPYINDGSTLRLLLSKIEISFRPSHFETLMRAMEYGIRFRILTIE